jgi:hypothetical protein
MHQRDREYAKREIVFDLFQAGVSGRERAITRINVDGKDVPLSIEAPAGHPDTAAYRAALDELVGGLKSGEVRECGVRGWRVEHDGKVAEVGDCDAGYPAGVEPDRPDVDAVARALMTITNIKVPHVPEARYI